MMKRAYIMLIVVLALSVLATQVFAATEYFSNGNPSKITTDKGTVTYYLNGNVEKIETPEGTATYNLNGNIDSIEGNPSISLDEAKAMLTKIEAPAATTATTPSTMPKTGVEDYYGFIIPAVLIASIGVGYLAFRYKNV